MFILPIHFLHLENILKNKAEGKVDPDRAQPSMMGQIHTKQGAESTTDDSSGLTLKEDSKHPERKGE